MRVHQIYAAMDRTIFDHMSALANDLGAINLGQGFPDAPDPPDLIEAAVRALREKSNQYPPGAGLPELRAAICAFYRRRQGLELAPEQIVVTCGATEALAAAIFTLTGPGDEVVLFQPAYDAYAPMVRRAGGVPVSVQLGLPDCGYRPDALERAITQRTRLLILNDPLNPAGTAASAEELAMIARTCIAHDLAAICDEVWEEVRFDGKQHRSLITFPGMAERTIKIGSAGKIFGLTGWKVGWMCAAPEIATALGRAHQFLTYTTAPALQSAVAEGLALPDERLADQLTAWSSARERLKRGLRDAGYAVLPNVATWFLCVDLAASGIGLEDRVFSDRAVREAGVATIPVSALGEDDGPRHLVRLCFTKPHAMLDDAIDRLDAFRRRLL